nr:receptor-like kinase TMK4 [Tanacetum cinerariifolium]
MTNLLHHTTFILLLLLLTTTTTTRIADDGAVMSILSSSISPTPSTWKTKTHYCSWQGISCDKTHHVTSIDLPSLSLTGTLPPNLNNLSSLIKLDVGKNMLSGSIPLFNLTNLETLLLDSNNFTFFPKEFFNGKSYELYDLQLRDNMLMGFVPLEITRILDLANKGNDACAGWEFVSCDANKNVTGVYFGKQNFSGTISPAFGNLTSLRSISLDGNNLVGPIPKVLTSLKDLQLLDVSRNNLYGIVPEFSPKHKYQKFGRVGSRESGKKLLPESVLRSSLNRYGKEVMVNESVAGSSANKYEVFSDLQTQSSGDHREMHVFEGGNVMISDDV